MQVLELANHKTQFGNDCVFLLPSHLTIAIFYGVMKYQYSYP